jgi:hypothetical protein
VVGLDVVQHLDVVPDLAVAQTGLTQSQASRAEHQHVVPVG